MQDSTAHRSITYRLLPVTRANAVQLSRLAGACRFVWNQVLADTEDLYRISKMVGAKPPSVSFFTLGTVFTQLRRATPWLQELPFHPVRFVLKRQADAWKAYFKGQRGRPRFKGRWGDDSFTIPDGIRIEANRLYIPKLGWVVLRRRGSNPYPDGMPKQVTVKRVCGKWFATVAYEVALPQKDDDGTAVGVDMNVRQVATSDGQIYRMPDLSRLEARKRRYQRMVARRQKGSKRRERARQMLAKASRRLATIRRNWQHQTTRHIANSGHTVVVEALNVQGMTQGNRGLNREILATGWGEERAMLAYKAGRLIEENPAYSSQTCAECGVVDAASRRRQSEFRCVACGHADNADVNAARNIMASGTGATGRGGGGVARPVKRQTVGRQVALQLPLNEVPRGRTRPPPLR